MPRYRVRLNDPNSDNFRVTNISAVSPEAAVEKVQEIDRGIVEFRLSDERLNDPDNPPSGAQLAAHAQREPYELAYVVERGDQKALDKARTAIFQGGDE